MITLKLHTDPGHGWLEVPGFLLRALSREEEVSGYSYYDKKADTFYLEEDCDAALVALPLTAMEGEGTYTVFDVQTSYSHDSFVRKLPRWEGGK